MQRRQYTYFKKRILEVKLRVRCDLCIEKVKTCLEGNETNELGTCSTGYSGVLCKSCEIEYSVTSNGIFTRCLNRAIKILILIILYIHLFLFVL